MQYNTSSRRNNNAKNNNIAAVGVEAGKGHQETYSNTLKSRATTFK